MTCACVHLPKRTLIIGPIYAGYVSLPRGFGETVFAQSSDWRLQDRLHFLKNLSYADLFATPQKNYWLKADLNVGPLKAKIYERNALPLR